MARNRVQAGRLARRKGKEFEREIVRRLIDAGIDTKRGWWQAKSGADVPDVLVDGFWLEASTGGSVDPEGKLKQALAQTVTWAKMQGRDEFPYPVAITRQRSSRTIVVTMYLCDLCTVLTNEPWNAAEIPVSFRFDTLVDLIKRRQAREQ